MHKIKQAVIKELEARKISLLDLASLSGVSKSTLYRWIHDGKVISDINIDRVCKSLNLSIRIEKRKTKS